MIDRTKASPAPDFTADDADGNSIQLSSYRGKKNVLLVFNRGFF